MTKDAQNFLEALLFAQPEDDNGKIEHADKSIYDFSDEFVDCVEDFIFRFKRFLEERGKKKLLDNCERSLGGNVYFSLSGHGCGFWDESDPAGEQLNQLLIEFSGNRYRFENLELHENEKGKLNCLSEGHLQNLFTCF